MFSAMPRPSLWLCADDRHRPAPRDQPTRRCWPPLRGIWPITPTMLATNAASGWPARARRVRSPAPCKDWTEAFQYPINLRRWWIDRLGGSGPPRCRAGMSWHRGDGDRTLATRTLASSLMPPMIAPPFTDTHRRLIFVRELLTEIERSFSVQSGGHAVHVSLNGHLGGSLRRSSDDLSGDGLRSPAASRETEMSKTHDKPALSPDQQAAVKAIRDRSKKERPGPDELIDQGEIDELVPQAQYIELRALMVRLRETRERMGLSLTDLSERTGLTRAAISRLENGWNLNPTLETLYRYADALGVGLKFAVDEPTELGKDR
jgi:DNA-binding XRE family transcriptional regulator